jgi:hypothetical protein
MNNLCFNWMTMAIDFDNVQLANVDVVNDDESSNTSNSLCATVMFYYNYGTIVQVVISLFQDD